MIDPRIQHRFEGDSGVDIASHAIDVVFPDGEKRKVVLRLGAPFRKPSDPHPESWWIRSELENLDSTDTPICGVGSLDTLAAGIRWLVGRLAVFEKTHRCEYFWSDTQDRFEYRTVLSSTFAEPD